MPPLTTAPPAPRPPLPVPFVRPITAEEYHLMADAGIFGLEERVELIDGQILPMSPVGNAHLVVTNRVARYLSRHVYRDDGDLAIVSVQNPVRLGDLSEPEPDVALLRVESETRGVTPQPADVLLIVEVADTTLHRDVSVKRPRYARAGIAEVWVVSIEGRYVDVARDPRSSGYQSVERITTTNPNAPSPLAFPEMPRLDVAALFRGVI